MLSLKPLNYILLLTMVYSGFSHFCFWQCSDSILTGSLPVHEGPPISFFTSGLLGTSPINLDLSRPAELATHDEEFWFCLRSFSEFEKTMKLSLALLGVFCFGAAFPRPGFLLLTWPPFLTIFGHVVWKRYCCLIENTS